MQFLAQYPLSESAINPYIGRPVGALLPSGDVAYGIIERIHDGHLVMRPVDAPAAAIQSLQNSLKEHPAIKAAAAKAKSEDKLRTSAWGYPGAYPLGWGYANYGWGAGWWWVWPLFFLLALISLPFLW